MCLSILVLRRLPSIEISRMARTLQSLQSRDGSRRTFGDDEPDGSWVTALAVIAFLAAGRKISSLSPAMQVGHVQDDGPRPAHESDSIGANPAYPTPTWPSTADSILRHIGNGLRRGKHQTYACGIRLIRIGECMSPVQHQTGSIQI